METILKVQNLKKSYNNGASYALDDVSFTLKEGEFVVIIGLSGSGKSTLLRCINGLTSLSSGSIQFRDQSVSEAGKKDMRRIRREMGMIFQHYNLIDRSTVIQNVLNGRLGYMNDFEGIFGLFSQDQRREALRILSRVGMEPHYMKRGDQLSGGQKQRVAICRALAQEPALMLADEPIASLDPASSKIVMDYLYKICKEDGITALVSLHQVDVAKSYATRILGVQDGKLVYDGSPADLDQRTINRIYKRDQETVSSREDAVVLLKDVIAADLLDAQVEDEETKVTLP